MSLARSLTVGLQKFDIPTIPAREDQPPLGYVAASHMWQRQLDNRYNAEAIETTHAKKWHRSIAVTPPAVNSFQSTPHAAGKTDSMYWTEGHRARCACFSTMAAAS